MLSNTRITALTLGAAFAGALSLAAIAAPANAAEGEKVHCYGVAKAGENDCANKAAGHSCATQSKVNYSGQDFKAMTKEACMAAGGSLTAYEGANPAKAEKK
ncbi:DUF2282 domain-containing protein [Niveispirillum sp.]|uniref:BufA1 family periplasmic bufferin-type metallophore n=1 Tax=Niveispirillum sp. TaxID=1917217 RepID=UPI001B62C5F6|nr:DUF2282 domain-containing protein [Niveispirillum sp.]MBP7336739.1 DUF2282 domain-containing protein [Niveispirillum sp.]